MDGRELLSHFRFPLRRDSLAFRLDRVCVNRNLLVARLSTRFVYCAIGPPQIPIAESRHAAVLDQLSHSNLCMDVPSPRHRPHQFSARIGAPSQATLAAAL